MHKHDKHHEHHVGDPIQFFLGDGSEAVPGQVLKVHDDGHTCCVVAYCPIAMGYKEHTDVPHCTPAEDGGPYFLRPGDIDDHAAHMTEHEEP